MVLQEMPVALKNMVKKLQEAGCTVYLFGGVLRDIALGVEPQDWDFAIYGGIEDIKKLFPEAVLVNSKSKTYFLSCKNDRGEEIEVNISLGSLGSKGGIYEKLSASNAITFNQMVFDFDSYKVIDFFDGLNDLSKGIIRVSNPNQLPIEIMMRIAKIVVKYNIEDSRFYIDQDTHRAVSICVENNNIFSNDLKVQNWKLLRSIYFGFLSESLILTFEWWKKLDLLYNLYFPELEKLPSNKLNDIVERVNRYPVDEHFNMFLDFLPNEYTAAIKNRLGSYIVPENRVLDIDNKVRSLVSSL
ncbi:hypothetical protein ACFL2G_04640 [Candidatus Omnitrophota bacterium]